MGKKTEIQTIQVQVPTTPESKGPPARLVILVALVVAGVLVYVVSRMSDEELNHAATVLAASVGGVVLLVITFFFGMLAGMIRQRNKQVAAQRQQDALQRSNYEAMLAYSPQMLPPTAWNAYNYQQQLPPPPVPEYSRPLGQTRSTGNRGGGFVESEPPGDWSDL